MDKISFLATFPAIQSAIKITGDGGGMRIQLDIPENQMAEAVKLMLCRQVVLRITVEVDEDTLKNRAIQGDGKKQHELQEGRKRKSEWAASEE